MHKPRSPVGRASSPPRSPSPVERPSNHILVGRAPSPPSRILVITGSRAEFGLLRPVLRAITKTPSLTLRLCVAGEHLIAGTIKDVAKEFTIDHRAAMQRPADRDRLDHARAFALGTARFATILADEQPTWVVVLGDRVEAFAAATAAAVAGIPICHIHGGDRAEGIADEAMRHAITKLAHLHCAASKQSAARLRKLGEPARRVVLTGSPALDDIQPHHYKPSAVDTRLCAVVLLHPGGFAGHEAKAARSAVLAAQQLCLSRPPGSHAQVLLPNSDPGREDITTTYHTLERTLAKSGQVHFCKHHRNREDFLNLLATLRNNRGVLIGNSSAGLIEAAALGVPVVNLGQRQAGRERPNNVLQCNALTASGILAAARRAIARKPKPDRRFGDAHAGERIATLLARGPAAYGPVTKHNSY